MTLPRLSRDWLHAQSASELRSFLAARKSAGMARLRSKARSSSDPVVREAEAMIHEAEELLSVLSSEPESEYDKAD